MTTIRPAQPSDAEAIADIYRYYVTATATSFETDPPDADEIARRMGGVRRYPWYVSEVAGVVEGYAYASRYMERAAYQWSVSVSAYTRHGGQRRGIGRALYNQLIADLRSLGYATALATITQPNAASVGFHEAMGFTQVAMFRNVGQKFGQWRDVGWWQLALNPCDGALPPPREWMIE